MAVHGHCADEPVRKTRLTFLTRLTSYMPVVKTGSKVPWREIGWTLSARDDEGDFVFNWVQYSTHCTSTAEPSRAFTVVSLQKVQTLHDIMRDNAPILCKALVNAGQCRSPASSVCLAITWNFEGHADQRVHTMPPGVIKQGFLSQEAEIARAHMPTKGDLIVSHTVCGHTELTFFNQSGINRPRVST